MTPQMYSWCLQFLHLFSCGCLCFYQWLQREGNPANYTRVVEELFRLIPDEGGFMDAGPQRCRTCSVVGNSGNLKGSSYGKLIDTSDLVIRSV